MILLPVVAAWVGYYAGAMREPSVTHMPTGATATLDHLVSAGSFSEVEQARAVLGALAEQYVESAQSLIAEDILSRHPAHGDPKPGDARPGLAAIRLLDEAAAEFEGTGQELRLVPTLLCALKREGLYDRWLQVYLSTLYRHPTHELVGVLAADAVAISRVAGRQEELSTGFRHLSGIPLDSLARSRIARSMARLHTDSPVPVDPCEHAS